MPTEQPWSTPDFAKYARSLDSLPFQPDAKPQYEIMSGALIWRDELANLPPSEVGWYRSALAYRSSVIMGSPRREFESVWAALKAAAPNWPGLRPERCAQSSELRDILAKSGTKVKRDIDRIDGALSGQWKPLSGHDRMANQSTDPTP